MSNDPSAMHTRQGTLSIYLVGFVASIVLTLVAYFAVTDHLLADEMLVGTIASLGIIQAFIQLFCFLHLGEESKPRWNLLTFLFMTLVVLIIVFGSLWIMKNLAYNVMPTMTGTETFYHEKS
jgi:cytochrome o ubiquinol oxidase operon protein cyoD